MNRCLVTICIFILLVDLDHSCAGGIDLNGDLYTDLSLFHYHQTGKDSEKFSGVSLLELKAENSNKKSFKFRTNIDFYLLYGEQSKVYKSVPADISRLLRNKAPAKIDLRELYFTLYAQFADIGIGRQIINFGKGNVLSPIDIFSPVNITDLNFKRNGSDVVNIKIPLGTVSGIDCITELPVDQQEHTSAMKLFTNISNFDLDLIGMYRHMAREAIIGVSFKGDVFTGVYGEYAGHFYRDTHKYVNEFMIGADYSLLSNDLIFNIEYSYNQNPLNPDTMSIVSLSRIKRPLFRRHYLFFNTQYSVNELFSLSGNVIYNIQDTALLGTAMIRYNILQNVNITGYVRGLHNNLNGLDINQPLVIYGVRAEVSF
jgi:hypothetical protein